MESELYVSYNQAYQSYLNNVHPMIFMNDLITNIVKTVGGCAGYIISSRNYGKNSEYVIDAIYNNKYTDDCIVEYDGTYTVLKNNSLCYDFITNNRNMINFIKICLLKHEPIRNIKCKSYMCIAYTYNRTLYGIIGIFSENDTSMDTMKSLNEFSGMIGCLQYNYYKTHVCDKLQRNENVIDTLIKNVMIRLNTGIIITEQNFDIIYKNTCVDKMVANISVKNCKNVTQMIPQLYFLDEMTDKIYKNRKIEMLTKDGKIGFVIDSVDVEDEIYHIITIKNINEKKCDYSSKHLMAYLSHELRNPLQSITLANHLIKAGMKIFGEKTNISIPEKIMSHIETVNKSCNNMKIIINDILDLSKIEANELMIDMEVCLIENIIDDVIDDNIINAKYKGLQINKIIGDSVPRSMYTDRTRIHQILHNLVNNAIKYTEKGSVTIEVIYKKDNSEVVFNVIDDGIGLNDDDVHKLFKIYGKTSNNYKNKCDSHGLGLCVSQKIANLLGGNITVKSKKDVGSIFSLSHPIKLGMSGNKYDDIDTNYNLIGNILVVDDNISNLELLHGLLDQFNYEHMWTIKIESVNNGKDAIELCKINMYDLIFMDINMTGIDGCTTSKIIKNNGYSGKIIATTGNIMSYSENRIYDNCDYYKNFDDIMIKPFDDQSVLKILKRFLVK